MALDPGTRLGHYEILSFLGAGGMGEVYRAKDTKLGREVAIKLLLEEVSQDAERLARFDREARILASLNHPNIATLHGFEKDGDTRFLVMEVVEGATLADKIRRGAIPVDEALPLFLQIAEGLEAAHDKGVIHRDLKPANIKVSDDGNVKILDFGLAKALAPEVDTSDPAMSQSPTLTLAATQRGEIMGTAAYMSPEQARGLPVDKRADVWAFGVCLYEALSGRRPFDGDDAATTMARVLDREPELDLLPNGLPWRIEELLRRCLEKDLRSRWHDIADVRVDIERVQADPDDSRVEAQALTQTGSRRALIWGLVAFSIGALLAGSASWNLAPRSASDSRSVRFSLDVLSSQEGPVQSGVIGNVAISQDGTRIAYVANAAEGAEAASGPASRRLYLRALEDAQGTLVPGTVGATNVMFSPDGEWVGFVAGGELQKARVAGGAPLSVTKTYQVFGASWGPNGEIIFGGGVGSGLMQVPAAGGVAETITSLDPDKGEVLHGLPEFLPDGQTVLFTIGTGTGSRLAMLSLETREWEELRPSGAGARYLSGGYLLFSEESSLRLVRFDTNRKEFISEVTPALDGVQWETWAGLAVASFAVSRAGDLVFIPGRQELAHTRLVWVDRSGEEELIDAEPGFYIGPVISPGLGDRIALIKLNEFRLGEVWVLNADGSGAVPVADDGADYNPTWSPDSAILTYTSNGNMYEIAVDRDEERTSFLSREGYQAPQSWSPDGQFLAFMEITAYSSTIWIMPREGDPLPLLDSSFNSGSPRFAPRGNWLAYVTDESGQEEVYVRRYPGSERGLPVSKGGGREPAWSRDGRELFYRNGDRMMVVEISTEPNLGIGEPTMLWERPYFFTELIVTGYDVAPDGRFLMIKTGSQTNEDAPPPQVNVVLNWVRELAERVAAN